jgi:hypothetical protein
MNENQTLDDKSKIEIGIYTQPPKDQNFINSIHGEPKKEEISKNFKKYMNIIKQIDEYKIKISSIEKQKNANRMEEKPRKGNHKEINNNIKGGFSDKKSKHIIYII